MKDHQRMLVDPMFIIIQNLWLFLTAFTPTAVAPTAVIWWNKVIQTYRYVANNDSCVVLYLCTCLLVYQWTCQLVIPTSQLSATLWWLNFGIRLSLLTLDLFICTIYNIMCLFLLSPPGGQFLKHADNILQKYLILCLDTEPKLNAWIWFTCEVSLISLSHFSIMW